MTGQPSFQAGDPLVRVRDLVKHFPVKGGVLRRTLGMVKAVDGVSFDIAAGETLGLVGESGCGKSTTGRALLRLLEPTGGSVELAGVEVTGLGPRDLRRLRRRMQMIFQDPYSSLNPRATVAQIIGEPLQIHGLSGNEFGDGTGAPTIRSGRGSRAERRRRVESLAERVGLSARLLDRFPHEFSGGQRQRVGIARALATSPDFIVADEPIAALDVSIQAQVVNLLNELKRDLGLTYLFIAHDLAMVRYISDRVAVMYLGRIVEMGETNRVFETPLHPYTRALLSAIPIPDPDIEAKRTPTLLAGDVPSPASPPHGCHFHPRCPIAQERCQRESPEVRDLGVPGAPHLVACHFAEPPSATTPSLESDL